MAPSGSDDGPGSAARPLATPAEAVRRVRRLKRHARGAITVYFRGGTYHLPKTLVLEPEDSGTEDAPITYAAFGNEEVVFSGGVKLEPQWKRLPDGTLETRIPRLEFDQLFVDGTRRVQARWPDRRLDERGVDVGQATGLRPPSRHAGRFVYDPASFSPRRWTRPYEAVIHVFQASSWGNLQWRVRGMDPETHTILLGEGGWQIGTLWFAERANYVGPHSRFYVENVREELDAAGEWYHDGEAGRLLYRPAPGEDPAAAQFVAAGRLRQLIVLRGRSRGGRPTASVTHVHLRGLRFRHTARIFLEPYETRLRGDWAIARLGAVLFDGAEDCSVADCCFDAVGGNGVLISNHARRITIKGCHFKETGESAVCLVGCDDAVRGLGQHKVRYATLDGVDTTPGPRSANYPKDCRIEDNLMHDLGIFGKQTAGVYISAAENITVSHNTIYRTPRAGICINDGCWGGHVIEFNDVFQTVRETGDHGPFNSWGRDRYWQSYHREGLPCDLSRSREMSRLDSRTPTIIQNNRFVHESRKHSWGIDLDDGSSNYILRSNLCLGCSVKLREGFYRTVENNIFVTPFPPAKQCCFPGSRDIIRRNILVDLAGSRGWVDFQDPPLEMDHNLYAGFRGAEPVFRCRPRRMGRGFRAEMTLTQWQAAGLDTHSVAADPQFAAPEAGDFRVKPSSPALALGFENFPMDRFGTRRPAYRAIVARVKRKCRLVNGKLQ